MYSQKYGTIDAGPFGCAKEEVMGVDKTPTLEEFTKAVEEGFAALWSCLAPEEVRAYIYGDDAQKVIKYRYEGGVKEFEAGQISRDEFIDAGAASAAESLYNIYGYLMSYESECDAVNEESCTKPTPEEFTAAVLEKFKSRIPAPLAEWADADGFFESEDAQMAIDENYLACEQEFDAGQITRDMFLNGRADLVAEGLFEKFDI